MKNAGVPEVRVATTLNLSYLSAPLAFAANTLLFCRIHHPILRMKVTIKQRLVAFISLLLISTILVLGSIAFYAIRKSETKSANERLESVTHNIRDILTTSTGNHMRRALSEAQNDTLRQFLQGNSNANTEVVLSRLAADSLFAAAQLYAADGRLSDVAPANSRLPEVKGPGAEQNGMVGNLYRLDSALLYPLMVPVNADGKTLGYLVKWRVLTSNPVTMRGLLNLAGKEARLFIANRDGSVWYDFRGEAANPIRDLQLPSAGYRQFSRDGYLSSLMPLDGTQWFVLVQLSHSAFRQTSGDALVWLGVAAFLLLVAGIAAARFYANNLSRPLAGLTGMAARIAEGDFELEQPLKKSDEIGKLSRTFHTMSQRVRDSQLLLQSEAEKYRVLFHQNPMPMWIMACDDFSILDVNSAAVDHYGYSREEFLSLTALDLRPAEDRIMFAEASKKRKQTGIIPSGIWRHRKKNGDIISVDVIAANLTYRNRKSRLILASDVTDKLKAEAELLQYKIRQQKILTGVSLQVQERERERLGNELHDNINQILTSVKLHLELGAKDEGFRERALQNGLQHVSNAIQEIRKLSKELVSPTLSESLALAVSDLLSEVQSLTTLKCRLYQSRFDEDSLDGNARLHLYRIIQEQVSNTIKHAEAKTLSVTLESGSGCCILRISDDGKGYAVDERPKGIGLRNIESRVRYCDGFCKISSAPGSGTTLEVRIPINVTPDDITEAGEEETDREAQALDA